MELAKRIEAARLAMMGALLRVPLAIRTIEGWVDELRSGASARAISSMLPRTRTTPETATEPAAQNLAQREAKFLPTLIAQLSRVSRHVEEELLPLSRAQFDAAAGGTTVSSGDRARLMDIVSRVSIEFRDVHLLPDRIAELVAAIEREHQALRQAERELVRIVNTGSRLRRTCLAPEIPTVSPAAPDSSRHRAARWPCLLRPSTRP